MAKVVSQRNCNGFLTHKALLQTDTVTVLSPYYLPGLSANVICLSKQYRQRGPCSQLKPWPSSNLLWEMLISELLCCRLPKIWRQHYKHGDSKAPHVRLSNFPLWESEEAHKFDPGVNALRSSAPEFQGCSPGERGLPSKGWKKMLINRSTIKQRLLFPASLWKTRKLTRARKQAVWLSGWLPD